MPIEVFHDYDYEGNHVWHTASVPETPVKEEPDCYTCNDIGCPECGRSQTFPVIDARWPEAMGQWGASSPADDEPPF